MSLLGQLLILIGADTSGLEEGTKRGKKKLSEFEQYVRSARKEMRFFRQAAQATGGAVAAAWVTSTVKDYVRSLVELKEQSTRTGKSIEDLTHGELLTKQVEDVVDLVHAFEMLGDATGNWLLQLSESSGLTAFLKDAMVLNAAMLSGKDSARILAEMKAPQLEATQAKEAKAKADADKRAASQATNNRRRAAEEAHRAEQALLDIFHGLTDTRDRLNLGDAAVDERNMEAKMTALGALPSEIELAKASMREIAAIKERAQKTKDATKRAEELDKWQQEQEMAMAQAELDEMHRADEERKRRMEQAAGIVEGRSGISAAERGTQAAFSAINKQRNSVEQKQLTVLQKIERNQRLPQDQEQLQTVDSL